MRKKGLTFIELIIVLAVLTVMAAGISFIPAEKRQLNAAAQQVINDIRFCQRLALSESTWARILFHESENAYSVDKWESTGYVRVKKESLGHYTESLFTNASGKDIEYTSRGTTGDACTIRLSTKNYTVVMTVTVGAGRVKITEIIDK